MHKFCWQHQSAAVSKTHQAVRAHARSSLQRCCALHAHISHVVFDEEQLRRRVSALGRQVICLSHFKLAGQDKSLV